MRLAKRLDRVCRAVPPPTPPTPPAPAEVDMERVMVALAGLVAGDDRAADHLSEEERFAMHTRLPCVEASRAFLRDLGWPDGRADRCG